MKKTVVFFDMDGVLYEFNKVSVEETFKKGYFANLAPQPNMVGLLKSLHAKGVDVCILSSVYTQGSAKADKITALEKANLDDINCIFVPYGESKKSYIDSMYKNHIKILIDDFSPNLFDWEREDLNVGIKCLNGINGTNGTWQKEGGYTISSNTKPQKGVALLLGLINYLEVGFNA